MAWSNVQPLTSRTFLHVLLPGQPCGQIVSCQNNYQDEHDLGRRRRLFNCFTSSLGLLSKHSDQGLLSTYFELLPLVIIPLFGMRLMLNNISDIWHSGSRQRSLCDLIHVSFVGLFHPSYIQVPFPTFIKRCLY